MSKKDGTTNISEEQEMTEQTTVENYGMEAPQDIASNTEQEEREPDSKEENRHDSTVQSDGDSNSVETEVGDALLRESGYTGETEIPVSSNADPPLEETGEEESISNKAKRSRSRKPSRTKAEQHMREQGTLTPALQRHERVLTIDVRDDIQTEEDRYAVIWHEIQNAYYTHRILTGTLDGVEKTESGLILAVVDYRGFRVAIPIKEMLLHTGKFPKGEEYISLMEKLHSILNARLRSEIDFIVKGGEQESRSIIGSRKEAMYRKRQTFYLDTNESGEPLIYEGRVVQARVVGVAEKVIRVEVFGVETPIVARDLSWRWIGDARDHFSVGDRILVRVTKISGSKPEDLSIRADVRSVSDDNNHNNLKKCIPQCRYAGRVTDIRNGVVFIRLNNGVNAIAHSCYDSRYPGKKDDVSFAVTRLDVEQGVAIGVITRIIKQNL